MKRVFVDTGGFLALLVAEDVAHPQAKILFCRAMAEQWRLVTSNVVVIETYSVLLARARDKRQSAISFLDIVGGDKYHVERIRRMDEERAIALLRKHEDKAYSLCDALSFAVMERLGIREAIAFDRHFREYGRFTIL